MVQGCAKSDWICMILRASLQLSLSLWLEHVSAFLSTLPFVGLPPIVRQDAKENQSLLVQWLSGKKHLPTFCAEGLPMLIFPPHATSSTPHIHQSNQVFCWVDQRSLDPYPKGSQINSPSQGSHEENPKMIGLLQINITRCHSLPPDQLCLVIETSRIAFFCLATTFFRLFFFHYNFSKNYMARGVSFNDDQIVQRFLRLQSTRLFELCQKSSKRNFYPPFLVGQKIQVRVI